MICEDEVHSAILCVQDFIRSPHFTQRNFFSDSGIAMLAESAAISDRITHNAVFEPWSHVETTSRSQVVADVCGCVNEALDRRRLVKDSQEQWYAVGGIRPSSEDSTSRSGVRISNIVEAGRVEYVPVRVPSFFLLVPVIYVFPLGSQKTGQLFGALWRDASKSQVSLQHLSNIVLLRIWVLVPLWTASNPARSHGVVREIEKPLLCSWVDCLNWYVVSNFGRCSVPFIADIDCHQHCETVSPLLNLYWYLCSRLVQSK